MRRRRREDRSGKKMPVSLEAGVAETAVSQLTGKTHRRRNWSSARRTCAKARVSNRGERDICRAGSACHPGRNARELMPGSRSIPRVGSQQSDPTLGSGGGFAKLRTSASASRSQVAKVRAEGKGEGRERREARSRGARPTATKERDGRWLGRSERLAGSRGRAVGAQLENGEETVVANDVDVAVREGHVPLWGGGGGGRRRAHDAAGVVDL